MWHGFLQLVLQLDNVITYDDVARSFVIGFMTKKGSHMRHFLIG
jgi:hypothetical protein